MLVRHSIGGIGVGRGGGALAHTQCCSGAFVSIRHFASPTEARRAEEKRQQSSFDAKTPMRRARTNNASRSPSADRQRTRTSNFGRYGSGSQIGRSSRRAEEEVTIQQDVRPATDWSVSAYASIAYARVPYAAPGVDMSAIRSKQPDFKAHHPLAKATQALRLRAYKGTHQVVQGRKRSPTPVARPGISAGAMAAFESSDNGANESSLADVARQERMRVVREVEGGEYQRWRSSPLVSSNDHAEFIENDAANAVALNDDLQPTHKAFTVNAVRDIVARTTSSSPK